MVRSALILPGSCQDETPAKPKRARKSVVRLDPDPSKEKVKRWRAHNPTDDLVVLATPDGGVSDASAGSAVLPPRTIKRSDRERDLKMLRRARRAHRARLRAEQSEARLAELAARGNREFVDFSWRDRRRIAICTYCIAASEGFSKKDAYEYAQVGARVEWRTVRRWVKEWLADEAFWSKFNWGAGEYTPDFLRDEDIKAASRQWWLDHQPKKGKVACMVAHLTDMFLWQRNLRLASPTSRDTCVVRMEAKVESSVTCCNQLERKP